MIHLSTYRIAGLHVPIRVLIQSSQQHSIRYLVVVVVIFGYSSEAFFSDSAGFFRRHPAIKDLFRREVIYVWDFHYWFGVSDTRRNSSKNIV